MVTIAVFTATFSVDAATFFQEDFSDNSEEPNMALGVGFSVPEIDFTGAFTVTSGDGSRIYLGTNDTDYTSVNFDFSAVVTLQPSEWSVGFFGLGTPDANPLENFGEPDTTPNLAMSMWPSTGHIRYKDNAPGEFHAESGFVLGTMTGTHKARMIWDAANQRATFYFDQNNNGSIDAHFTVGGSDNAFDASNAQLLLGGGAGIVYDDIEIVNADLDGDGMMDRWEIAHFGDPITSNGTADADGDSLSDKHEHDLGTNPNATDSDFDGLTDEQELYGTLNPFGPNDPTDPANPDTDGDFLLDGEEVNVFGTDPLNPPAPLPVEGRKIDSTTIIAAAGSSLDPTFGPDNLLDGDTLEGFKDTGDAGPPDRPANHQGNHWLSNARLTDSVTFDLGGSYDLSRLEILNTSNTNWNDSETDTLTIATSTDGGLNFSAPSAPIALQDYRVGFQAVPIPAGIPFAGVTHVKLTLSNDANTTTDPVRPVTEADLYVGLNEVRFIEFDGSDTDSDGMPDDYEAANGLDPFSDDGNGNKDGDSFSNLMEYGFGLDPCAFSQAELSHSTYPVVRGGPRTVVTFSPLRISVEFMRRKSFAADGLTYAVQFSHDMVAWEDSNIVPAVVADDGDYELVSTFYTLFLSNGRKAKFFRIAVNASPPLLGQDVGELDAIRWAEIIAERNAIIQANAEASLFVNYAPVSTAPDPDASTTGDGSWREIYSGFDDAREEWNGTTDINVLVQPAAAGTGQAMKTTIGSAHGLQSDTSYAVYACLFAVPGIESTFGGSFGRVSRNSAAGLWRPWNAGTGTVENQGLVKLSTQGVFGNGMPVNQFMLFLGNIRTNADGELSVTFDDNTSGPTNFYFCGLAYNRSPLPDHDLPYQSLIASDDGMTAQVWFNNPRGVILNGPKYLNGVVTQDGQTSCCHYDPATGSRIYPVSEYLPELDDHGGGAFVFTGDNAILHAYTDHNRDNTIRIRKSLSLDPSSLAEWGPENAIPMGGVTTYAVLLRRDSDGRIFLICRTTTRVHRRWRYIYTDNDGATWSNPETLLETSLATVNYMAAEISGDDIHIVTSETAPNTTDDNDLYHLRWDTVAGNFYDSADSLIEAEQSGHVLYVDLEIPDISKVWDNTTANDATQGRPWVEDIAITADGTPLILFAGHRYGEPYGDLTRDATDVIRYFAARWTGFAWETRQIAWGGNGISSIVSIYSGGAVIDPVNPDRIFISTNAAKPFALSEQQAISNHGPHEIWRGLRRGSGLEFDWSRVTQNTDPRRGNFRLEVIRDAAARMSALTWQEGIYGPDPSLPYGSIENRLIILPLAPVPIEPNTASR